MSLESLLFGPLNSNFCMLFYVLMVVVFLGIVSILGTMFFLLINGKKIDVTYVSLLLNFVIVYFTHRILYSMCRNTL